VISGADHLYRWALKEVEKGIFQSFKPWIRWVTVRQKIQSHTPGTPVQSLRQDRDGGEVRIMACKRARSVLVQIGRSVISV
jgi:hypothetical protein